MSSSSYSPWMRGGYKRRQIWHLTLGAFVIFSSFLVLYQLSSLKSNRWLRRVPGSPDILSNPPTWEKLKQWQRDLPQHNLSLPFPEGRTGRYVKFANQIQQLGWNNVLNEVLMNVDLAYKSKRGYVFQDYTWKKEYYYWPESKFRDPLPYTPLNALISGPAAGGPWDEGDDAPRSISEAWFDVVCPKSERRVVNTRDVKGPVRDAPGDQVFAHWEKFLRDAPERCIEIEPAPRSEDNFPQTFDLWLWGSSRILPLWEIFSKSPASRLHKTSPIVRSAVDRNEYLFLPKGPRPPFPVSRNPYDRMLAIHVRRGDYKEACVDLAKYHSTFYSWNLLPFLPDPFPQPDPAVHNETYMKRCLPSTDDLVKKVKDSRDDYVRAANGKRLVLDILYLLTNEKSDWLDQFKETLRKDGWVTIVTSKDLELDQEQMDVNMAVDMDIARKAAVFIGNGWSSFTSNILHRRLVDGKEPISNRFY